MNDGLDVNVNDKPALTQYEPDFGSGWVLRVQIRVESGGVGPPGLKFGLSRVKLVKFGHTKAKYILYN